MRRVSLALGLGPCVALANHSTHPRVRMTGRRRLWARRCRWRRWCRGGRRRPRERRCSRRTWRAIWTASWAIDSLSSTTFASTEWAEKGINVFPMTERNMKRRTRGRVVVVIHGPIDSGPMRWRGAVKLTRRRPGERRVEYQSCPSATAATAALAQSSPVPRPR